MKAFKVILSLLLSLLVLVSFVPTTHAALVTITQNNTLIWSVLSFDSELSPDIPAHSSLKVKSISQAPQASPDATIYLQRQGDKTQLTVESLEGKREADISNFHEDIIEIEQTPQTQTINISAQGNDFLINQNGISARTSFPIQINAQRRELSVETTSGLKYVSILPYEAVENTLRANLINRLEADGIITLSENERGELEYRISGSRVIEVLNLVEYSIPVSTSISASTGQILNVDQPTWFSILGFLFA
jgi:hypothetical protein